MNALLLALAVPALLASASEYEPPPEDFWLGWLWLAASLGIVFALYLLADGLRESSKKFRRGKWRLVKTKAAAFLRSSNKSGWSSDDEGGSTI
jgi:hypothetical protein